MNLAIYYVSEIYSHPFKTRSIKMGLIENMDSGWSNKFAAARMSLEVAFREMPEPLDFVFPGLIAESLGVLVSPGGVGKSYLALEKAISVAVGRDVFGIWDGEDPDQGRVVVLSLEDPAAVTRHRLFAMGQHLSDADKSLLEENLDILSLNGEGFSLMQQSGDGLKPSAAVKGLQSYLEQKPPRLIVIDTLNRALGGANENCSTAMSAIINQVEKLNKKFGCASLIVHHTNKASYAGAGSSQGATRGSSALTDNARFQENLQLMSEKEADARGLEDEAERRSWVRLDLSKANYAPVGNEVWLKRDGDGLLWGAMPPPRAVKESNSRRKASDVDDSLIPW
jgi:hypothetical protein